MVFYLTFDAFRANRHELNFVEDMELAFKRKVEQKQINMEFSKRYAWLIDKKEIFDSKDLLNLSYSCKAAIFLNQHGAGKCFDLNGCSLDALNYIFIDNQILKIGVILDIPFLITKLLSQKFLVMMQFEGMMSSMLVDTPFELFSAGVKDVCLQLEKRIEHPVMTYSTLQAVMKANNSLDALADEMKMLKIQVDGVAETGFEVLYEI